MPLPFETMRVDTDQALKTFDALRAKRAETGRHPFLIGDDKDLAEFAERLDLPADGGADTLVKAAELDVAAWLASQKVKNPRTLGKGVQPQAGFSVLYDVLSRAPKPCIHIGLLEAAQPEDLFAKLGFGGWNDCPDPAVHVALHRYWREQFSSIPVAITSDVVECFVPKPPTAAAEVLNLAGEQYAYCYDIVEQGFETKSKLAASLLGAKVWYFWWD